MSFFLSFLLFYLLKDIIQIPPNSAARNFNECDILGQVKRDEKGNIATADLVEHNGNYFD